MQSMAVSSQVQTITVSIPSKPNSPTYKTLEKFKEVVEFKDPSLRVNIQHSCSLYKQGEEIAHLKDGSLDMATISMADICGLVKDRRCTVLAQPYVLESVAHLTRVFDSTFGQDVFNTVEETISTKILAPFYIGTRVITLKDDRKVKTPADLEQLRLRVPVAKSWEVVAKCLGATPVPVSILDIKKAYEDDTIDGHENPISASVAYDLLPYVRQIVRTDHLVDSIFLSISTKKWNALTEAQKEAVTCAAQVARLFNDEMRVKEEAESLVKFKDRLVTPNLQSFKDRAEALLNTDNEILTHIRSL